MVKIIKSVDEIRADHKYGIGQYEMKILGKNENQIKIIKNIDNNK